MIACNTPIWRRINLALTLVVLLTKTKAFSGFSMFRVAFLASVSLSLATSVAMAESPLDLLMKKQRLEAASVTASVPTVAPELGEAKTIHPSSKAAKPAASKASPIPRRRADDSLIAKVPSHLEPHQVIFISQYAPGTLVIDTSRRALFRVLNGREATRYGVAVGKEGFEWSGTEKISARAKWPDWRPPAEMRQRDPSLPEFMPGGPRNPLGARALYLGRTLYRIHGTWNPRDIGRNASSGCIRMLNAQVAELYELVKVGETKVVVSSRLPSQMLGEGRGDTRPGSEIDRIPITMPAAYQAPVAGPYSVHYRD
jgi:lipoprotein-anchoring transpeptidase ErfK/SrfK